MKNYKWTQTFYYVTLELELEQKIKSKDISCKFTSKKLNLNINGNTIFDEKLEHSIYPEGSNWYIDSGILYIEMSKVETKDNNGWWLKCFQSDENPIDVQERLTRPIYECSPELQEKAREMYTKSYKL